jgi:hypothetical protein
VEDASRENKANSELLMVIFVLRSKVYIRNVKKYEEDDEEATD